MADLSFEFKNMIGHLFFDRAKNVPDTKQLSEDLVNSMYGTAFCQNCYRVIILAPANLEYPDLQDLDERIGAFGKHLLRQLSAECYDILYHFDSLRVRMLLNYPKAKDDYILSLLRTLLQSVPLLNDGRFPTVLCCSRSHDHIQDTNKMVDEASNIMWTRFSTQEPMLIHPIDLPPCPPDIQSIFSNAEHHMKSACAVLDLPAFESGLNDFFSLPDILVGRIETRAMIRSVEYYMFDVNRDLISTFTDTAKASQEMVLSLHAATSLSEYKRRYRDYIVGLMRRIIDGSSRRLSRPIRQAQRYIQENFTQKLRLEDVARQVGLTPVYLCSRFKQETGIGFSDYCNQYRIEQAKLLLKNSQRSIVDIAHAVGFSGPRYFSRIFKEFVGIRPTQYRTSTQDQTKVP